MGTLLAGIQLHLTPAKLVFVCYHYNTSSYCSLSVELFNTSVIIIIIRQRLMKRVLSHTQDEPRVIHGFQFDSRTDNQIGVVQIAEDHVNGPGFKWYYDACVHIIVICMCMYLSI